MGARVIQEPRRGYEPGPRYRLLARARILELSADIHVFYALHRRDGPGDDETRVRITLEPPRAFIDFFPPRSYFPHISRGIW
jgi:hypothetical protein